MPPSYTAAGALSPGDTATMGPARASTQRTATMAPSVRGTILAALGAITSLGTAAAIGLASTEGSTAPNPPATRLQPTTPNVLAPIAHP